MAAVEFVKWSFLGSYFALESCTIVGLGFFMFGLFIFANVKKSCSSCADAQHLYESNDDSFLKFVTGTKKSPFFLKSSIVDFSNLIVFFNN